MDLDLTKPQFSQNQIAEATGIPVGRIRNWVARDLLKYTEGDQVAVRGSSHLLSASTAIRIALLAEMSELVSIEAAAEAARRFHTTGAGYHPEAKVTRQVSGLFDQGETFLFVYPNGRSEPACRRFDGSWYPHDPVQKMFIQPVDEVWHRVATELKKMPIKRETPAPREKVKVDA